MKSRITTSFDELIRNRHGSSAEPMAGSPETIEQLFGRYYGKSARGIDRKARSAVVVSLSFNDGETLPQLLKQEPSEEYLVQQTIAAPAFEEYVVSAGGQELTAFVVSQAESVPVEEAGAHQECQVDVREPVQETKSGLQYRVDSSETLSLDQEPSAADDAGAAPLAPEAALPPPGLEQTSRANVTDDDFISDIQSILSGQKQFDQGTRTVTDKVSRQTPPPGQFGDGGQPAADSKNGQAIFDRIAQSMEFANAYDLGTVELTNRFGDFDRIADLQEKRATQNKSKSPPAQTTLPPAIVGTEDFVEDLKVIQSRSSAPVVSSYGQELLTIQQDHVEPRLLSQARRSVIYKYWPQVKGAKYQGSESEKAMWQLLLPAMDLEKKRLLDPGYATCGALVSYLLKQLGGIDDPGIVSGGISEVRDGIDTKQKATSLEEARRIAGPYAWLDDQNNIYQGGAKHLGEGVWVPNEGSNRPKPGDIYLLEGNIAKAGTPPVIGLRHAGVIVHVASGDGTHPEIWQTADAIGEQSLQQQRTYNPVDRTVTGTAEQGTVTGWIDLDNLVQRSAERIARNKAAAGR